MNGRAYEVLGKELTFSEQSNNNAGTWYDRITNGEKMQTPVANSIAVWGDGTTGYVAYVENVVGNDIYFTEANWSGIRDSLDPNDGIVKTLPFTSTNGIPNFKLRNGSTHTLIGFIRLT